MEASYVVALRFVRALNCHTVGEDLPLPVAKDIVRVIGDEFVTQLSAISLFNYTVCWRIDGMSAADILHQVIQEIKYIPIFMIQFDQSIDVTNCSLVYAGCINDGDYKMNFSFANAMKQHFCV